MELALNENKYGYTHLEIETMYDKGGYDLFTYKEIPRGYYIVVNPVTISNNMIAYEYGKGIKHLIEQTARFSQKKHAELDEHTLENADSLIKYICSKYNLSIAR